MAHADSPPPVARRCTRRAWLRLAGATTLTALLAACAPAQPSAPAVSPTAAPKPAGPPPLALTPASSELVVGPNRFLLAILEHGRPVAGADATFEFFQLDGQTATKRADARAAYRAPAGPGKGLYVARATFDQPGNWGVQVTAVRADGPPLEGRVAFQVKERGAAPMIGDRAIPSRSLTRDVADPAQICSAQPPCDMHALSLADALARSRPLMIAFATPGYCSSQTCAPVLGEVQKVQARRSAQADFVHVEIYKDPRNLIVADTVTEWRLQSEPWVFVVDRSGQIADRLESVTDAAELDAALAPVL